ncbi:MAG TPA: aldo/keto reductase [Terriglobales bacterium]|nr:aldo/keto reductase [Terriglobales bacterium]
MKYRSLGKEGPEVSEIGFGAWGIGKAMWVGAEDADSLKTLAYARDCGINFFDTALAYGDGHSERLLAQAFGKSEEVVIASKVPPMNMVWPAQAGSKLSVVFPYQYVMDSLNQSLKNLGREYVDVYQFHVWSDEWADSEEWQRTAREMRSSGQVRQVGISINDHQPTNVLKALKTGLVQTVQVIYNIFDQSPEDELFKYCQENGIGVIARVPFDEGSLTGKIKPETKFAEGDFRNVYFQGDRKQQVWGRAQAITKDAEVKMDELPSLALRFCLSHPAVSSVIPGMRREEHVRANAAVSDQGRLDQSTLDGLRKHRWVRSFYAGS